MKKFLYFFSDSLFRSTAADTKNVCGLLEVISFASEGIEKIW